METITNASEIDHIFKCGRRVTSGVVTLIALQTPEARGHLGRVLFVAGKRIGGAVVRNRSKRVLRAAVRRTGGPWPHWDVVLMARAGAGKSGPESLDDSIRSGLRRLGVVDR